MRQAQPSPQVLLRSGATSQLLGVGGGKRLGRELEPGESFPTASAGVGVAGRV